MLSLIMFPLGERLSVTLEEWIKHKETVSHGTTSSSNGILKSARSCCRGEILFPYCFAVSPGERAPLALLKGALFKNAMVLGTQSCSQPHFKLTAELVAFVPHFYGSTK